MKNAGPEKTGAISIGQRLMQNSALAMVCRIITALTSLISIPVIVSKLGVGGYGIWETLLALASLSILFQNAISGTLLWRISKSYGSGDVCSIRRAVGIGMTISLGFVVLIVPLSYIARHGIVVLFNVPTEQSDSVMQILPFIVGLTICGGINESFAAAINGSQRMGISLVVQSSTMVVNYTIVIICLLAGGGFWSLVAGQFVGVVTSGVVLCTIVHRMFPGAPFRPLIPTRDEISSMYTYAGCLMIGSFSAALRDQTDKLVLATFASPVWVGYYGIAARLASLILEFNRFFYTPLIAASAALHAQGNWDSIASLYRRVITTVACCTGGVLVLVISLYDRIMIFWLGHYLPEVTKILILLVAANTVVVVMTGAGTSICKGIGRAGIETAYIILNLIANLALTIILVLTIGPMGTVYASVSTWILGAIFFEILMHRKISLPVSATLTAFKVLIVAVITATLSRTAIDHFFVLPGSRSTALFTGILLSIPALAAYIILLVFSGVVTKSTILAGWQRVGSLRLSFKG